MLLFIEPQTLPGVLFSGIHFGFLLPLRYEPSTDELINEELGIAYPIIDGIPNMIPQAARMTHQNKKQEEMKQH